MIPEIGILIAFYVTTRMLEILAARTPTLQWPLLVFTVLTVVVAVIVGTDLALRGTSYTINPYEAQWPEP